MVFCAYCFRCSQHKKFPLIPKTGRLCITDVIKQM